MIVTLTGAYKNVGDHLIRYRAHQLLKEFVDSDIVNIDRLAIKDSDYEIFNKAKMVILCGGPAYQKDIYPRIYPVDLSRIKVPVIPFGLGYKAGLGQEKFKFNEASLPFVKELHSRLPNSSARDIKTVQALNENGISNVTMTGCPAWYDLSKVQAQPTFPSKIKKIVFSSPANIDSNSIESLRLIKQVFPQAKRSITYHHGVLIGTASKNQIKMSAYNVGAAALGILNGYQIVNLREDLNKMFQVYDDCDLHVGYRVHAHLYCLSQKKPSILLSEDSRGVSQSITLGREPILTNDHRFKELLLNELRLSSDVSHYQKTFAIMGEKFEVMKNFLQSLPR